MSRIRRTREPQLGMEVLERRQPMAVVSVATSGAAGRKLDIKGNDQPSDVSVVLSLNHISVTDKVNGFTKTVPVGNIDTVAFYGGAASDKISVSIGTIELIAWGKGGNDILKGGPGNDRLFGGDGDDALYGNGGRDDLRGDNGDDTLWGGTGDDRLFGEDGRDRLDGGTGNDILRGGNGNDHLYGGDGHDRLFGDAGADNLNGEKGNDVLSGGPGKDSLNGGSGTDTFERRLYAPGFYATDCNGGDCEDDDADVPVEVSGSFLVNNTADRDSPWDINQAQSPTCAFLAALATVADHSSSSSDLVKAIKFNDDGSRYGIPIYHAGKWTTQWVDGMWTEGRDPGNALWVTLYQKAYLQAWGVKSRDTDGRLLPDAQWRSAKGTGWETPGNALNAVAEGFSKWIQISNATAATIRTQVRDATTYGLVASSKTSGTTGSVIANHAYMVYDAFTSNNEWRVRLFNPWGKDGSGKPADGKDDGLITLSWSQFTRNFSGYHRNT